jgi:exonuclease III
MIVMAWNLHDWSANRESPQAAQSALLSTLCKSGADVVFLNEVRNLEDLHALVDEEYEVHPSMKFVQASSGMLAQPTWDLKKALEQKDQPYTEYYALLVRRDCEPAIRCDSNGWLSINARQTSTRVSPRGHTPEAFSIDESSKHGKVLVCRQYRPSWHWTCFRRSREIEILGLHTKPIGSKQQDNLYSTMSQTAIAVRHATESFLSQQWIVCGDFYADPSSLQLVLDGPRREDAMESELELKKALEEVLRAQFSEGVRDYRIEAPTQATNHPHKGAGCIADYFVLGAGLRVIHSAVSIDIGSLPSSGTRYSDHDPVLLEIDA